MEIMRTFGPALSPMNAWLLLQGTESLHVRMDRHCANTLAVAKFLQEHPRVAWVNYPGLSDNKYHHLAQKYLPKGASGLLNFGVKGGAKAGERFIEAAQFMSHLANIGDAKTLVIHPASTTHRQMEEADLLKAGVTPDTVIVSVTLTLIFFPAVSFRSTSCLRVSTNWLFSTFAEATGSTLPHPQSMLASRWPPRSYTPNHPAAPPGIVSSHSPRKGFSAARPAKVEPNRPKAIRIEI